MAEKTVIRRAGSSPHTRGAQITDIVNTKLDGIIPACAGSTRVTGRNVFQNGDHPRMRGEHNPEDKAEARIKGSSPHARGAQPAMFALFGSIGIIPAYAGSTAIPSRKSCAMRDHPRIRGEHS